jgi:FkbH-like protein
MRLASAGSGRRAVKAERMQMTAASEPIRLVIWDLDETFWSGTLTEGGITYRRDFHDIVLALAKRGIVSSICSKNDLADVRKILEREGIWDSFVFPSVNWDAKGPRLAALVEAVQLRPPTILFIDDNAMNRAEAQHFVPGIQVADETVIPSLLDNPLCRGKDDSGLTRLAQYRLLQRRQADEKAAGGDNTAFLRESNIRISIEHDLEPHLDRAIELINRTNQLNFTKNRLPEDPAEARAELRALLSGYTVQAGIVRVRDNYGDYGYCGFYVMRSGSAVLRLVQFCFSCRILNMGVESWLYQHLGRPSLRVQGEVLTDVVNDERRIDWITAEVPEAQAVAGPDTAVLDYVYARGGCDLHAVTHYFNVVARDVHREFNTTRDGANMRFDHTVFARYALNGITAPAKAAFTALGYLDEDYGSFLTALPRSGETPLPRSDETPAPAGGNAAWVLSFWADADFALYRHKATGLSVPLSLEGVQTNQRDMSIVDPDRPEFKSVADKLRILQSDFEYTGMIGEAEFKENVRMILGRAPQDARVFVLMANELIRNDDGKMVVPPKKRRLNGWVRDVAVDFRNVELVNIRDFVLDDPEMKSNNHFDRMVYFRVFKHIMKRIMEVRPASVAA